MSMLHNANKIITITVVLYDFKFVFPSEILCAPNDGSIGGMVIILPSVCIVQSHFEFPAPQCFTSFVGFTPLRNHKGFPLACTVHPQ